MSGGVDPKERCKVVALSERGEHSTPIKTFTSLDALLRWERGTAFPGDREQVAYYRLYSSVNTAPAQEAFNNTVTGREPIVGFLDLPGQYTVQNDGVNLIVTATTSALLIAGYNAVFGLGR